MPPHNLGARLARACAVEMHMDISEGSFYARMNRKNARGQSTNPDLTPALTPTVRSPQCGHAVWGIIYIYTPVLTESYKVIIDLSASGGQHISPRFAWMSRHQSLGGSRLVIFTTGREELCCWFIASLMATQEKIEKSYLMANSSSNFSGVAITMYRYIHHKPKLT